MCACTTTSLLFMSLLHYGGVRNISLLLLLLFYYNFFFNIHVVVFVCLYALERHTITFISQQLRSLPSYRRVNHKWVCTFHFVFFIFFFSLITFAFLNLFRILLFSSTVGCCFGCVISNGEILIRCRALNENWKNIFITKMSDTRWAVNTCAQWNCKLWNRVWYTENCEQIEIIFSYKKIVQRCLTKHVTIATDSLVLEFTNLPVCFGV